jgi:PTS system glucitol/sorbitol-specific IIA component
MGSTYYESTVLRAGQEAAEMAEGGVLILYAEPIPDALEEVSVVHAPTAPPSAPMRPGDLLTLDEGSARLIAVGERADENLRSLGHMVVYLNPEADTPLLPGAVHATGSVSMPAAGARLRLAAANAATPGADSA